MRPSPATSPSLLRHLPLRSKLAWPEIFSSDARIVERIICLLILAALAWPTASWATPRGPERVPGQLPAPGQSADALEPPPPGRGLALIDAIRTTLEENPTISIAESSVDSARGGLLVESGVFDPLISGSLFGANLESPTSESASLETDSLTGTVGGSWQLRSGQLLEPSVSLDWTDTASDDALGVNTGTLSFSVVQPLLRGRRRQAVVGSELAAERELLGTRFDWAHTAAATLRNTATQYWQARAALIELDVLRDNERRSGELLEQTRRLVEAELTPAADLLQLEANLISAEVSRIAGEAAAFRQLRLLATAMGLDAERADRMPLPSDPLPDPSTATPIPSSTQLLALAYRLRGDLRASVERVEAAERLLAVASDALRPRLDLVLEPSWEGLVDGDDADDWFSSLFTHVPGASISLGLRYAWPVGNDTATGAEIQARAGERQRRLAVDALRIEIGARVPTALDSLVRTLDTIERLERSIALFEKTVENQIKKLRAGQATLIDVIDQRDRLVAARQSLVRAQLSLAIALVDLRFETGTLVSFDEADPDAPLDVGTSDFVTLPTPR